MLKRGRKGEGCAECATKKMRQQNLGIRHTVIDLTGQIIGDQKILKQSFSNRPYKPYYWVCQCLKCGEIREKSSQQIRLKKGVYCSKKRISYGELEIEKILKENNIPFEKEYSFNPEGE